MSANASTAKTAEEQRPDTQSATTPPRATDAGPDIHDLYTRLARPVAALAYQLTGDPHLAEDVLQETFLAAHQNAAAFRDEASPDTWIYRIAINAANRARRKRHRRATILNRFRERIRPERHHAPPQNASHQDNAQLHAAIDRLSEHQRTAILLLSLRNIPAQTIAEALDLPINTLYSRAHAARKALRTQLKTNQPP